MFPKMQLAARNTEHRARETGGGATAIRLLAMWLLAVSLSHQV
jgi:hypothetical protein